uniref:Uncharacterized protein n=1 Tax=Chlorobium phaeobacteroides (strain BS1) TaxID=331678 RepID=B3ELX9_CHLPB
MPDQVRHDFPEGMDAGSPREIDVWISQGGMTFRGAWMPDHPCNTTNITQGGMTIVT